MKGHDLISEIRDDISEFIVTHRAHIFDKNLLLQYCIKFIFIFYRLNLTIIILVVVLYIIYESRKINLFGESSSASKDFYEQFEIPINDSSLQLSIRKTATKFLIFGYPR